MGVAAAPDRTLWMAAIVRGAGRGTAPYFVMVTCVEVELSWTWQNQAVRVSFPLKA